MKCKFYVIYSSWDCEVLLSLHVEQGWLQRLVSNLYCRTTLSNFIQISSVDYFYHCTVHSVVYLITHTPTRAHVCILFKKSKIYVKTCFNANLLKCTKIDRHDVSIMCCRDAPKEGEGAARLQPHPKPQFEKHRFCRGCLRTWCRGEYLDLGGTR